MLVKLIKNYKQGKKLIKKRRIVFLYRCSCCGEILPTVPTCEHIFGVFHFEYETCPFCNHPFSQERGAIRLVYNKKVKKPRARSSSRQFS